MPADPRRGPIDFLFAAIVFAVPLACWPSAGRPFSTPKLLVIVVGLGIVLAAGVAARAFRLPAVPRTVAASFLVLVAAIAASAVWGLLVSPAALVLQLAAAAWLPAIVALRPAPRTIAGALVASATAAALVALGQWARLDPFAILGYVGDATGRMRVYGTLGNPNFLAVFLVAVLPLTVGLAVDDAGNRSWRRVAAVVAAIQAAAIVATGSRGAVLAALAIGLLLALVPRRGRRPAIAVALLVAVAVLALSAARPLGETIAGRAYIWKIAAPHVMERPVLGVGPGAFEPMWVRWETRAWSEGTARGADQRFAAVQDHAHNDYLEFAADSGLPATLALAAVISALIAFVRAYARRTLALAAGCGVVAIAAAALVDFPLHRPTELFVFWALAGVALLDATPAKRGSEERRAA